MVLLAVQVRCFGAQDGKRLEMVVLHAWLERSHRGRRAREPPELPTSVPYGPGQSDSHH
ncbi:MAG: hypothetical protein K0S85_4377 [Pseudomonas orientalis]|nr:hypothetical protein [Pseudomonas orientalis]